MSFTKKIFQRINAYRGITPAVAELFQLTKRVLPANPRIIEAGAHMGFDTLGLATVWPKGTVYAFEPVPGLFSELRQRVQSKQNIKTYQVALGPENRQVEIFVSGGSSSGSSSILTPKLHKEIFPSVTFNEKCVVEMVTIESWALQMKVDKIDLMWLDMQGYEVSSLKGAGSILKNVSVIYTELCNEELYDGMVTREEFISFLDDNNFELIHLTSGAIGEGVFVNRALHDQKRIS